LYDQAISRLEELENRLYDPHTIHPEQKESKKTPFPDVESLKSNVGKEGYMKVVERMKEHIACGGIHYVLIYALHV
jgi:anthranilate/para-aminobenzoate synthase component I